MDTGIQHQQIHAKDESAGLNDGARYFYLDLGGSCALLESRPAQRDGTPTNQSK